MLDGLAVSINSLFSFVTWEQPNRPPCCDGYEPLDTLVFSCSVEVLKARFDVAGDQMVSRTSFAYCAWTSTSISLLRGLP